MWTDIQENPKEAQRPTQRPVPSSQGGGRAGRVPWPSVWGWLRWGAFRALRDPAPWCFVLALLAPVPTRAAFEFRPIGARAGGMGDTFVAQAEGVEALFWNPASVAWGRGVEGVGGYDRPFGMGALETQVVGVVVPVGKGVVGMGYLGYGFSLYLEQTYGVTYGVALSSRLGVGLMVRGIQVTVAGMERRRWAAFDLGVRAYLAEGLVWGLSAWNAGGAAVDLLGQGGMMGVGFEAAPGMRVLVDVRKEAGAPTGVSAGMEYRVGNGVALRTGVGGRPERLSLGVGVRRGVFRVDYAAIFHTVLGLSHRVSVLVGRRPSK